jgi:hypothetical protein
MQFRLVRAARQTEQLTISIRGIVYVCVPVIGVEEDAVCFAAESSERVEEHDGMTELRAVGRVQAVCIIGPIDSQIGAVFGYCRLARWVQEPANEDEAEEVVCVTAPHAERWEFIILGESRELV